MRRSWLSTLHRSKVFYTSIGLTILLITHRAVQPVITIIQWGLAFASFLAKGSDATASSSRTFFSLLSARDTIIKCSVVQVHSENLSPGFFS